MIKIKPDFKIGDRVRIKPYDYDLFHNTPGAPGFAEEHMNKYCGDEFVIEKFSSFNEDWVKYKGWVWSKEWLEPVECDEEYDIDQDVFDAILSLGG